MDQRVNIIKVKKGMKFAIKLKLESEHVWKNIEKPLGLRLESCYIDESCYSTQYWIYSVKDNFETNNLVYIYAKKHNSRVNKIKVFKIILID